MIHRVELLWLPLHMPSARIFRNIFRHFFIIIQHVVNQPACTVIQHCPITVFYSKEYLQVFFLLLVTLLSTTALQPSFLPLLRVALSLQSLVILTFTRLFSCNVISQFLMKFDSFARWLRLTSRLPFRMTATSLFVMQYPFAARFCIRWWACLWRQYFVFFLCVDHLVGFRLMLEHAFQTALVINLFLWSFKSCPALLIRALLPTIHWNEASMDRSDSANLLTLHTIIVSKTACWTTLISYSSTKQKIGTLIPSFPVMYPLAQYLWKCPRWYS